MTILYTVKCKACLKPLGKTEQKPGIIVCLDCYNEKEKEDDRDISKRISDFMEYLDKKYGDKK